MAIKSDRWIRRTSLDHNMINPFSEKQFSKGVISYGLSSYGYDLRVADEFKIFTNVNSTIVDPKNFDERSFVTVHSDVAIIPPNPTNTTAHPNATNGSPILTTWASTPKSSSTMNSSRRSRRR